MRLRILWFGRPGADPCPGLVEGYRTRVSRRWPAEDVPLRPARGGRDRDPAGARTREAAALFEHLPSRWVLVALDERGRTMDSPAFAAMLRDYEERAVPGVALAIGSDLGLDPSIRERADRTLSLGPMTLPHLLARAVLWEQLFRAVDILGGGAYHRG